MPAGLSEASGMVWCCAGPVPLPHLPGPGAAAGPGPGVRVRPGGVQRLPAFAGCLPRGRGEDFRYRGAAPGRDPGQAHAASVALVQACQDARRAYRNWFDSMSGQRKGRRVGHPRFRSRRGRQSIRLTRNGFALHGARLYLAKVGQMRVRWSRPLPSVPSSLTVIKEADGRYYASFVVQQDPSPLPACGGEVGIDVGLVNLAATSDGEIIANPRFLRKRERRLARAQRALSRKVKGSANILAAGRADRLNACGGDVGPGQLLAVAGEAGTTRSAA